MFKISFNKQLILLIFEFIFETKEMNSTILKHPLSSQREGRRITIKT
jgi:hypothetical protein